MNNAEWVNKRGYNFKDITAIKSSSAGIPFITIYIKERPIETLKMDTLYSNDRFVLAWLGMEHIEPVLDDVERRYLKAVIKPFRNKIHGIEKDSESADSKEFLYFYMDDGAEFFLPDFPAGTMYKGMKRDREYTIKELGL